MTSAKDEQVERRTVLRNDRRVREAAPMSIMCMMTSAAGASPKNMKK